MSIKSTPAALKAFYAKIHIKADTIRIDRNGHIVFDIPDALRQQGPRKARQLLIKAALHAEGIHATVRIDPGLPHGEIIAKSPAEAGKYVRNEDNPHWVRLREHVQILNPQGEH